MTVKRAVVRGMDYCRRRATAIFNRLPATTRDCYIDPEHMEHWGTIENLHAGFYDFVTNIPFYGAGGVLHR
jgi:DNA topoisomerase IB